MLLHFTIAFWAFFASLIHRTASTDVLAHTVTFPTKAFQPARLHLASHQEAVAFIESHGNYGNALPCVNDSVARMVFSNLTQLSQRADIQVYHRTGAMVQVLYHAAYLTSYDCASAVDLVTRLSYSLRDLVITYPESSNISETTEEERTIVETTCGRQEQRARVEEHLDRLLQDIDNIRRGVADDYMDTNILSHRGNLNLVTEFSRARGGNTLNQLADQWTHLMPLVNMVSLLMHKVKQEINVHSNNIRMACEEVSDLLHQHKSERTPHLYRETLAAYFPLASLVW